MVAAILLTLRSFVLTIDFLCLQLCGGGSFLLRIGDFYLQLDLLLVVIRGLPGPERSGHIQNFWYLVLWKPLPR